MSLFFPSIFVPFIGLVFPFLTIGSFLVFIQKEEIS